MTECYFKNIKKKIKWQTFMKKEKLPCSLTISSIHGMHFSVAIYKANSRIDDGEKNNQKSIFINPSDLVHHSVSY